MRHPLQLYRYRRISDYAIKELEENKVYLAKPDEFNDPFDARLRLDFDITLDDFRRWFHLMAAVDRDLNLEERIPFFLQGEEILAKAGSRIPPFYEDTIKEAAEEAIDRARQRGILCLSQEPDNILLWSHYAQNHTGICIEYSLRELEEEAPTLHRVRYTDKFPQLRVSDVFSENPSQKFDEMLSMKHLCWSYEKEWRIITEPAGLRFFNLPITRVIFGITAVFMWMRPGSRSA